MPPEPTLPAGRTADGWQCQSCGAWWPDNVVADYCQGCHEKVAFGEGRHDDE